MSNETVLEKANIVANKGEDISITWDQFKVNSQLTPDSSKGRDIRWKIKPISQIIKSKQVKLLGHIIRAQDDPMKKVTLADGDVKRKKQDWNRVGRPRENWVDNAAALAFERCAGTEYDKEDATHRTALMGAALMREF